uniref:Uncharacterized protein n=1 Tax=Pseudomonas fluorescens (strain SBW25) TaxID=216595 RepID=A0A0G4E6B5_PSEFS|nr:hypothetical protein PQBR55_0108 [Pseudomonas fluorescens SBW25]
MVVLKLEVKHRMQTDLFSAFSLNQKADAVMLGRRSVCIGRSNGENKWTANAGHKSMHASSN